MSDVLTKQYNKTIELSVNPTNNNDATITLQIDAGNSETINLSSGSGGGTVGPQGPAGPAGPTGATGATGPQGPSGVVAATSPVVYTAGTQTVSLDNTATYTVGQLIDSGLTASTVPYADASKQLTSSSVTPTELGYVHGVTGAIQTQIDGKQATGNYVTGLTGDVTASGPGSVAATLATVNSNTGSFGSSTAIPNFTVNGKGLLTAAGSSAVIAPAGTLTGTTLASNVVSSSLTSVGTITSGTWTGTSIAIANGGTGQTTQQTAIDALTGTQSAGKYLRSDGTHATLSSISAGDVPTLNQNTTGTAAGLSSTLAVSSGGTGATSLTANNVVLGNGTSAVQFVAPGTSGNVLTSNGTTWTSAAPTGGGGSTQYLWSGFHNNNSGTTDTIWSCSSTSFGDFTNNESSITFSEVNNVNFGTVTGYGASSGASALPGIVFTVPATGYYFIKASLALDTSSTNIKGIRLRDKTNSVTIDGSQQAYISTGQFIFPLTLSGIVSLSSGVTQTISIEGATDTSGTFYICGDFVTGTRAIEWSIFAISTSSSNLLDGSQVGARAIYGD